MGDPSEEIAVAGKSHPAWAIPSGAFILWSVFAILALILAAGAVVVRLVAGARFDGLLMVAACVSALLLVLRIPKGNRLSLRLLLLPLQNHSRKFSTPRDRRWLRLAPIFA